MKTRKEVLVESIAEYATEIGARVTADLAAPHAHELLSLLTRLRALYEDLKSGKAF